MHCWNGRVRFGNHEAAFGNLEYYEKIRVNIRSAKGGWVVTILGRQDLKVWYSKSSKIILFSLLEERVLFSFL
jgi:hypothetical protein